MRLLRSYHCVLLIVCLCCAGMAAENQAAYPNGEMAGQRQEDQGDAVASAPDEFILYPVREGFSTHMLSARGVEVAFKNEPDYVGSTVYRHAFRLGADPDAFIGVAYDAAADTLYIDRNRNLDLTDDGPGITGDGSGWDGYSRFSNVLVEMDHDGVTTPYYLDFTIISNYYFSAEVRSGWQGDIEVAGQLCSIGISDNMDGVFDGNDRFRMDHVRHREARLPAGRVDETPLPRWLYFEDHSYHFEAVLREEDGETVVAVTLSPIEDPLMDLAFEGQFVSRLLLREEDSNNYGLVEWPVAAMRIPQGRYTPYRVDLLDSFSGYPRDTARVDIVDGTLLKTGGPLRHDIAIARSGAQLNMHYALRGVDGTEYSADHQHEPPGVAIYQGGRLLASGNFEYG